MSSYIKSTLLPDEKIVTQAKLHWALFIAPAFLLAIALTMPISSAILFGGFAIFWAVMRLLTYYTTELVLTNKRVVAKFGVISRKVTDIQIGKVEGISYKQGVIARLLGYGSIHVRGTGIGTVPVPFISNPEGFKRAVSTRIVEAAE